MPPLFSPLACQLCDQLNHRARECPLLSRSNSEPSQLNAPSASTAMSYLVAPGSSWYFDSGASIHVSSTCGNLLTSSSYSGS
ncbi:hypothetical protein SLEP1_g58022 [Rubroshorea leprosula]|uniref:Uncharacterized protein n=1 Tax=Rubroshorea leprosula TaxID=152421 RepID=A0AAV5MN91_9ROSI|nr:hypothetical protein SLEP1_g58022 [Rubroshorea leprosula]